MGESIFTHECYGFFFSMSPFCPLRLWLYLFSVSSVPPWWRPLPFRRLTRAKRCPTMKP